MSKGNNLYSKIHFRKMREVVSEIADYEGIDISEYDLFKMKVYETSGENLKGKNVSYEVMDNSSCWVKDNRYVMVEIPSKTNRGNSVYGDFLFLAYNNSYNYHLFGKMSVSNDQYQTKRTKHLIEKVSIKPYGRYDVVLGKETNSIMKVQSGYTFDPGVSSKEHMFGFDSYNVRKKAYGKSKEAILRELGVTDVTSTKLIGNSPVKIYKGNKRYH
jgi:hypothetical protein